MPADERSPATLPWLAPPLIDHAQRLLDSYARWLGRELIDRSGSPRAQAERLFATPAVVVSHGGEDDPLLNYGNRAALELWEFDWPTLVVTPSRLTAEPVHRDERARMLGRTARDGYVDDYQGVRITRGGRRFFIPRATVWNVVTPAGAPGGQAATFAEWRFLDA